SALSSTKERVMITPKNNTPPAIPNQFHVYVIPVATINKLNAINTGNIDDLAMGAAINSSVVCNDLPAFFAYQKGSDSVTTGIGLNVSSGGGDATVHSNDRPFHGSAFTCCPFLWVITKFHKKIITPIPIKNAPTVLIILVVLTPSPI